MTTSLSAIECIGLFQAYFGLCVLANTIVRH